MCNENEMKNSKQIEWKIPQVKYSSSRGYRGAWKLLLGLFKASQIDEF